MKKITKREIEAAKREVSMIRQTLDGETNLLCTSHNPRLVMYTLITEAIRLAPAAEFGPDDFLKLTADIINLYTGETDGRPYLTIVEIREDD